MDFLPLLARRPAKKVKITSLVDICAKCIALHAHKIPKEGYAALHQLHLDEAVQKHMGRRNQIQYFHQYRTHYRDDKPELLEHYDNEGRKHGKCFYWNENGRMDSLLKYHHGLPHGAQRWYDQRGVLIKQFRYKEGKFKEEIIIEKRIYSPFNFPFHHRTPFSSAHSSPPPTFSPMISTSLKSTPAQPIPSCASEKGQHRPAFSKPLSLK